MRYRKICDQPLLSLASLGLLILAFVGVLPFLSMLPPHGSTSSEDLYFGVDVAYGDVAATKLLIDRVSPYTNLFVIGCLGSYNESRLDDITQYVYDKGLYFIIYSDSYRYPSKNWFEKASSKYGNRLLGVYYFDEVGGKVLDQSNGPIIRSAANYTEAAQKFVSVLSGLIRGNLSVTSSFASPDQYKLFTSDYAFYWFDYQAGYDVVLAQLGWNNSRQLNMALCRGAATAFGKEWGVIITWTYRQAPYIESGPELYDDLVLAYENGAKYILIFDSNEDYSASILREEHFEAMQRFWQYFKDNPRTGVPIGERVAYVLPKDYAYGFRGEGDRIWGLWGPDSITAEMCDNVSLMLENYGTRLDLLYPGTVQALESLGYNEIFFWSEG
ncbi:MAG: hypothetical protein QFX35_05000 [Candidatus Verstraetearchaeota archaeon]|nr:hypothetical protein [Candidatus Verstraetearchaeota archaeon]